MAETIRILKLRSMHLDAETLLERRLATNEAKRWQNGTIL